MAVAGGGMGEIELAVRDLPALGAGCVWELWANGERLPCLGCGAVLPYFTAEEAPHDAETGRHIPIVFTSASPEHRQGRPAHPSVAEAGLDPAAIVAVHPEDIGTMRLRGHLPHTGNPALERAIHRAIDDYVLALAADRREQESEETARAGEAAPVGK